MTIPPDLEAQILRYYWAEKWRVGTIARQLHVHPDTVSRVLSQAGLPRIGAPQRPSKIDPFLPFIQETLTKFPKLTAKRLHGMVWERGYRGCDSHFRHIIARLRPHPPTEGYLRLRTLPAEQAQTDWASFKKLTIGRAVRPLMAFVMVLSYSRQIFLRFFLDARTESFLRGHVAAFEAWQGCPRVILTDNLRSAVLERQGDAIRFNPALLNFAAHYRYEPRPVAPGRGSEKGRVERAIRYVREAFFAGRRFTDLDDLNAQAEAWCNGPAAERRCPEEPGRSVRDVFADEAPLLLKLPDNPYPVIERKEVVVGKTPYVRFDMNDYSVPHKYVRRSLTVLADPARLRIITDGRVIADHRRSYDKGEQVENPDHIRALVEQKRQARRHRAIDRLARAVPASRDLLVAAAERGEPIGRMTKIMVELLDRYGAAELQAAVLEVMNSGGTHYNTIRQVLDRRRDERGKPPPVSIILPEHVRARDKVVQPHSLDIYDELAAVSHEEP